MKKFICILICIIPFLTYGQTDLQPAFYSIKPISQKQTPRQKQLSPTEKYAAIDNHAKNAPAFDEDELNKLVKYLITPCNQNEELKARAIFVWIVYHINFDVFRNNLNTLNSHKNNNRSNLNGGNSFETRVGLSGDFADLYVQMGRKADLKVVRIDGVADNNLTSKNARHFPHAWNAVYINKNWYPVDIAWAMSGDYGAFDDISNLRDYRNAIKERKRNIKKLKVSENRGLNEEWFMTPPETMIETHIPYQQKWYLTDKYKSMNEILEANEKRINNLLKSQSSTR